MTDKNTGNDNNNCPCGSEKPYDKCCKKEYDNIMETRARLKAALSDPSKAKELADILKQHNKNQ